MSIHWWPPHFPDGSGLQFSFSFMYSCLDHLPPTPSTVLLWPHFQPRPFWPWLVAWSAMQCRDMFEQGPSIFTKSSPKDATLAHNLSCSLLCHLTQSSALAWHLQVHLYLLATASANSSTVSLTSYIILSFPFILLSSWATHLDSSSPWGIWCPVHLHGGPQCLAGVVTCPLDPQGIIKHQLLPFCLRGASRQVASSISSMFTCTKCLYMKSWADILTLVPIDWSVCPQWIFLWRVWNAPWVALQPP